MKGSANTKPPVEIDSSVEWISYTQLQNVKGFDILREKFAIPAPLIDYLDYANLYRGSAVFYCTISLI